MAAEATARPSLNSVPQLSGNRDILTIEERERSLDEAIQWLRDELNAFKSQDQSLMRQFLALRSEINTLKDDLPTPTSERSRTIDFRSPTRSDTDDVFFADDPRKRVYSDPSIQRKLSEKSPKYSGSDDEKF